MGDAHKEKVEVDRDRSSQHLKRRDAKDARATSNAAQEANAEAKAPQNIDVGHFATPTRNTSAPRRVKYTLKGATLIYAQRPVHWLLAFAVCGYLMWVGQRVLSSPCSVLGVTVPRLNQSAAARSFRQLAKCTHPDRFSNLNDKETARILYTRLSAVNSDTLQTIKDSKRKVYKCYDNYEKQIYREAKQTFKEAYNTIVSDFSPEVIDLLKDEFSFEFSTNFLAITFITAFIAYFILRRPPLIWRYIVFDMLRPLHWFVIQPVCSVLLFFALPFMRLANSVGRYINLEFGGYGVYVFAWHRISSLLSMRNLRRSIGTKAVQTSLVATLLKPLFPIVATMVFGAVERMEIIMIVGVPLLIGKLPAMRQETMHLLVFAVGIAHTLIGVNSNTVLHHLTHNQQIELRWEWDAYDILSIISVGLIGAEFAATSELGNEPMLMTSFTAGVTARVVTKYAMDYINYAPTFTLPAGMRYGNNADILTASTSNVGSCGKGGYAWFLGQYAGLFVFLQMLFLAILPAASAIQWYTRCGAARTAEGSAKPPFSVFLQRSMLLLVNGALVLFTFTHNWNGIPNQMSGFILTCLYGCVLESFLSCLYIKGKMHNIVLYLIYLLA